LFNAWDEICVQVQAEQSIFWGAYEDTARAVISGRLDCLSRQELCAIWLQTDAGEEWASDEGESSRPSYCLDDVVDHLWSELLGHAGAIPTAAFDHISTIELST
jgi:hypothetical protein